MGTVGVAGPEAVVAIAAAAVAVGSLHALAPDHWVPFVAMGRAQGWSPGRAVRITAVCGFGHVTASVLLGLVALLAGIELVAAFGRRLESWAGLLLVAFGLAYAAWGLRRAAGARVHGHVHRSYDHVHDAARLTPWALFLLFSADPCVAVIPLIVAAAPLGALAVAAVTAVYEAATLATMVALVLAARRGAEHLRARWLEPWADAAAGVIIATVGGALALVGA